jgi:uncharacterized delta-60 repeat protein
VRHTAFIKIVFSILVLFSIETFSQVQLEWLQTYHGPANGGRIYKIAVDSNNDIIVSGQNISSSNSYDLVTIKYNPAGDTLWLRRFSNGNNDCYFKGIAVDNSGNVYVTGYTSYDSQLNCIVLKYSSSGELLWNKFISNSPDTRSIGIAVDNAGNPYVAGERNQSTIDGWGIYAAKLNPDNGNIVWSAFYDYAPGSIEIPYAMTVDGSGNVFVCGYTQADYIYSMLAKFSAAGSLGWSSLYKIPGVTGYLYGNAVKTDQAGNIYIAGKCYNGQATFDDFLVMKYLPNGDTAWVNRYSVSNSTDEAFDVAVDYSGNVYATGKTYSGGGGSNNYDYLTVKFSPTGNFLWNALYDGPGGFTQDEAKAIAVDNFGNCYVTGGSSVSSLYYNGAFATIRYDQNGQEVWSVRNTSNDFGGTCLALDNNVNIYVGGSLTASYATLKYVQPPVPVEFISFNSVYENGSVHLKWNTATEKNNKGFEIQRKVKDGVFTNIYFVDGHGTTLNSNSYDYLDRSVTPGVYVYRLKQIDFDGASAFSPESEVTVVNPESFSLEQNYPNPFNPSTVIKFSLPEESKVTLKIINAIGQEIAQLINENKPSGEHKVDFNAKELSSGIYFYRLDAEGINGNSFNSVKKMILIR